MMKLLSLLLVSFVSLQHFGFMVLEMYFWNKPLGLKVFKMGQTQADATHALAMNQGLYNGFLAAGLVYGLCQGDPKIQVFFLICVVIAGIFGAATASKNILFIQALPAAVAIVSVFWTYFLKRSL